MADPNALDAVLTKINLAKTQAEGCRQGAIDLAATLDEKKKEALAAGGPLPEGEVQGWLAAIESNVTHAQEAEQSLKEAKDDLRKLFKM